MKTFILVIVGGSTSLVGSGSDKHRSSFSSIEQIARISIELPSKVRSRFEMQQWLNLEASINKPSEPLSNWCPAILNPLVLKTLMHRRAWSSRMCDLKRRFLISALFNISMDWSRGSSFHFGYCVAFLWTWCCRL